MNTYMSDQEQLQEVKKWLKQYGPSVILGVAIAIGGSYGWNYWNSMQAKRADQASMLYEQLLIAKTNAQTPQFNQITQDLKQNYPHSAYADLAGLMAADAAVGRNDLTGALQQLQWVSKNAKGDLQVMAQLRSARVLLAQNQVQPALQLLQTINNKGYAAEVAIIQGDAYVALGDNVKARTAYQTALNLLPATAAIRPLVQMKFDDLA